MYKVLLLGESGVGKTNLLTSYTTNVFNTVAVSTIAVDFVTHEVHLDDRGSPLLESENGSFGKRKVTRRRDSPPPQSSSSSSNMILPSCLASSVKIQLWDTAGQERYNAFLTTVYRGSHGALVVFDLTNRDSFEAVENWVLKLREHTAAMMASSSKTEGGARSFQHIPLIIVGNKSDLIHIRAVKTVEAAQLAESLGVPYVESSALTRENVEKAFGMLVSKILHHHRSPRDSNNLGSQQESSLSLNASMTSNTPRSSSINRRTVVSVQPQQVRTASTSTEDHGKRKSVKLQGKKKRKGRKNKVFHSCGCPGS